MEAKDKARNQTQSSTIADRARVDDNPNPFDPITGTATTNQAKTSHVVPSTGGSDEELPKPYRSSTNT